MLHHRHAARTTTLAVLPFTREIPGRRWLGFVPNPGQKASSPLTVPIALLAVLCLGVLVASGGKQEHAEEGPPPSSAAAAAARMGAAQASGDGTPADAAKPEPEPEPEAPADPSPAEPANAVPPTGEAPAADEAAKPATDATPDGTAPTASPEPQPEPEAQPEPRPKREPAPPKPLSAAAQKRAERAAPRLRAAISSNRVKKSRENFVVAEQTDETSWTDAKAHCAGLSVDGVGGWKLPTRGEAREIQRGGAIKSGAYWTRQRAKFEDSIYVHDTRTRRSSAWLEEEIANVVCVQPRPR